MTTPDLLLLRGDALAVLKTLASESVHCCVTSPPYWGLRDYGTAKWMGGDPACPHKPSAKRNERPLHGLHNGTATVEAATIYRGDCRKCGARRVDKQLGLERTYPEYITRLVEVFREVRRVLRADGTLWLVMGDSYATGAGKVGQHPGGGKQGERWAGYRGNHDKDPKASGIGPMTQANRLPQPALKPKNLVGVPWRVAFALQADGWYLRSDIIWAKPNPMPESVTDRPTKAHEYVFLLAKSQRYFYDADAVMEAAVDPEYRIRGKVRPNADSLYRSDDMGGDNRSGLHLQFGGRKYRNRRTVWTVTPRPYSGAHFATFPPRLIEPCILAGCPEGGTVLDPFAGAGTSLLVARDLNRNAIGIELNPKYVALAKARLRNESTKARKPEITKALHGSSGLTGGAYAPPGQTPHSNARKAAA